MHESATRVVQLFTSNSNGFEFRHKSLEVLFSPTHQPPPSENFHFAFARNTRHFPSCWFYVVLTGKQKSIACFNLCDSYLVGTRYGLRRYRLFRSHRSVTSFCVWIYVPSFQIQMKIARPNMKIMEKNKGNSWMKSKRNFFINEERKFQRKASEENTLVIIEFVGWNLIKYVLFAGNIWLVGGNFYYSLIRRIRDKFIPWWIVSCLLN